MQADLGTYNQQSITRLTQTKDITYCFLLPNNNFHNIAASSIWREAIIASEDWFHICELASFFLLQT